MRHLALALISTTALAQTTVGSTLKLGASDESAFPAASTLYRGGLRYGTDAGAVYFSNGSAWTALGTGSGGGTAYTSVADGGVVVAGTVIACEAASATGAGCVNTTTQTFAGAKTFSNSGVYSGGANLDFTGASQLRWTATGNQARFRSALGASAATTTVAAFELQHTNGALAATDLELAVLDSSSNRLLTLDESGQMAVRSGHQLNTAGGGSKPTCASGIRGTIWYVQGGAGTVDSTEVCAKDSADAYAWTSLSALSGGVDALAPSLSITGSAVEMLSVGAGTLGAARTVQITAHGTAYSTDVTTLFEFYADVNGTPAARRRLFFNAASSHQSWSGSWIVTLPAAAVTIKLYGIRMSGSGTITLNADDFVSLVYKE